MRTILNTVVLSTLLLLPLFLQAQQSSDVKFDSYSSEILNYQRGLSQNTIQCLLQDSRGFIWIGTWDGLNRFDGYQFMVYKPDYNRPKGKISNETINALVEDKNGNIWAGTDKGLNMYQFKTDSFKTYFYSFYNINSLPSDSISSLVFDKSGVLWIGTSRGLCSYEAETGKFTTYHYNTYNPNTIPHDIINDLMLDENNRLWVSTPRGIAVMDVSTRRIHRVGKHDDDGNGCGFTTCSIQVSHHIWVGTRCGLFYYSESNDSLIPLNFSKSAINIQSVSALLYSEDGYVWIGTDQDGVYIYNVLDSSIKSFYSRFDSRYGLSNNSILSLLKGRTGEIWVGTWHGLNKYSAFAYKFPHFRIDGPMFDFGNNLIWSFVSLDNGNLLVGTENGLVEFNVETNVFSHFSLNEFGSQPVRYMTVLGNSDIMVGTNEAGLFVLDQSGHIKHKYLAGKSDGLAGNTIWKMVPDNNNHLWIATYGGVSRLDLGTGEFVNWISPGYASESTISSNIVNNILVDRSGIVWISTFSGLNRLDPKTGKIFVFRNLSGNSNSLSNDRILSVFEDRKGILWIGTMGGGLNSYDRQSGLIRRYTASDGLPDNVIYDIIEDKKGFLWLTSNKGLIRFNPRSGMFVDYDINDGVQSHEFNLGAAFMLDDGRIAVGGMNGFNLFNPEKIKTNDQIPAIVITGFKIFNKPYGRYVENGDTIVLDYDNNFFSISFSALDFTNPSKNLYSYRLKNYDKDWIKTDAMRRTAEYTDVKPGTYIFQVRGSNSDGLWNEEGISFIIIVEPPFYQTWLFRILLVVIMIVITWLFIRGRIRKVRNQNEVAGKMLQIEKQMFDLEQKALRLQMNPHFIFNSLNSIQSYILASDTEKAINYLAKFSQLMRLILTTSRETHIPVSQEISLLKYYIELENMRFNNRFVYEIMLDQNIDTEFIGIPPMIVQPYIENAIIHGLMNKKSGQCNLLVQMWMKGEYILCVVEDNGIGRDRAREIKEQSGLGQKSQGIIITQERLDILNSQLKNKISVEIIDLKDGDGKAIGTRVRLVIPCIDL
ncbi:MAG: hypothetical protein CVU11_09120 [Bacteroidetes bacterium HGW-Bacteroidetes-6]|nr:MAG: hypothetical protein CVU11_09120 [Bacteroidetes bacterium HGW-Bacteroidetes-6]